MLLKGVAALLLTGALTASAEPLKVLFIGNSYTYQNDLPQVLAKIAASAPEPVTVETGKVLVGGSTLQQHWSRPAGFDEIRRADWDYVVLQDHSLLGGRIVNEIPELAPPDKFFEFARLYNAEIRKTKARTVFYLTWSREKFPETQAQLTEAYRSIAKELSAVVAPVGLAFMNARIGKPGLQLYMPDQSHPSPAGTYLAACVFYAVLTGRNPAGLTATVVDDQRKPQSPKELVRLSAGDAEFLQQVAWRTVQAGFAVTSAAR